MKPIKRCFAINVICAGGIFVISESIHISAESDRLNRLTERQRDCLSLVAQGFTSKEIGRQLGLSPSTVDNHILAAMQVLDSSSRGAAARTMTNAMARQNLPSQPSALAKSISGFKPNSETERKDWFHVGKLVLAVPPLGGRKNDLDGTERTIRIFQVAALSLGLMLSITLVIAGAFTIFR